MAKYSKLSKRGGVRSGRVDVAFASKALRELVVRAAHGNFTQNVTTKVNIGALGKKAILVRAYLGYRTLPAGGALTVTIVAYDASANAEVALTDALDPETGTVREPKAFVLAATNVALEANDSIEIHVAADNVAVGTQQVDGYVTLVFDPVDPDTLDQ